MATLVLASGSAAADSAPFTITVPTKIWLSAGGSEVAPTAHATIRIKDSSNAFSATDYLTGKNPSGIIPAGTYICSRQPGVAVFSIERE